MSFALLTAFLFALSAVCGSKIASLMDPIAANFWRLVAAATALGAITFIVDPGSISPDPFAWLLLSGAIGFGIGDIALFLAYPRIGARLTILINFCLATLFGAFADWLWLGDGIAAGEWLAIVAILGGLSWSLLAAERKSMHYGSFAGGIFAAVVAGFGQGFGATVSRHAVEVAEAQEISISGVSQAFQRVLAGLACVLLLHLWRKTRGRVRPSRPGAARKLWWLAGAALFGPVIGVSCFQHSLGIVGSSGVVMAVVATSPLMLIPLGLALEGDRPTRGSVLGAVVGVGGVIAMALLRSP